MLVLPLPSCTTTAQDDEQPPLARIAFGSCIRQDKPAPLLEAVAAAKPDLFLLIGDNIYGDSEDMAVLRAKYALLGEQPGYKLIQQTCPILATWDDHDYGVNDGGLEYPKKAESQKLMLEFFGEPQDSPRWERPGVYHSYTFGPAGKRVQVILLDTRYFRDALKQRPREERRGRGPYMPDDDESKTMLGEAQWKWLEAELRKPAELRIIASSIQVVPQEHGWEYWANLPHERRRLFKLIGDTKARGVVFISGDRHLAEISRLPHDDPDNPAGYDLYDLTSSSINQPSGGRSDEPNRHRVGENYRQVNFGVIEADWRGHAPAVELQIRDDKGDVVRRRRLTLDQHAPN